MASSNSPTMRAIAHLNATLGATLDMVTEIKRQNVELVQKLLAIEGLEVTADVIEQVGSNPQIEFSWKFTDQYETRAVREEGIDGELSVIFEAFGIHAAYSHQTRDEVAGVTTTEVSGTVRYEVTPEELKAVRAVTEGNDDLLRSALAVLQTRPKFGDIV